MVGSAWHLRVPYFFAPYRTTFGLGLAFRRAFSRGNWLRMVRQELGGAPSMRQRRCRAFADMRLPPEPEPLGLAGGEEVQPARSGAPA